MTTPTLEAVQAYYDERVEGKIRDFTHANPRIEAAVQLVAEWAPPRPKRILEIGCGIGATCWRMARAWPDAEVIGADVSLLSIGVAKTCFQRPNLSYRAGLIKEGIFAGSFDLVVLMDVYEHIALSDRPSLHRTIKSLLGEEARVIITVPTPATQNDARKSNPSLLQPVDEDVTPEDFLTFAASTDSQLLYYREVGIWRYGDYAHGVVGRCQVLADVKLREFKPAGRAALKQHAKRLLGRERGLSKARTDYLGSDVLRPTRSSLGESFQVSPSVRRRLASFWLRQNPSKAGS